MTLLIKVDEDLPEAVAKVFAEAGYHATTVRAQGWSGVADEWLWEAVQREGRTLVTADKGFGDIRSFRPSGDTAIVLLRAHEESRRVYIELAQSAVASVRLESIVGCLAVVSKEGIRVRRPTDQSRPGG